MFAANFIYPLPTDQFVSCCANTAAPANVAGLYSPTTPNTTTTSTSISSNETTTKCIPPPLFQAQHQQTTHYDFYSSASCTYTPDSVVGSATSCVSGPLNSGCGNVFSFEPATIERLCKSDRLLEADEQDQEQNREQEQDCNYYNYDDINCQSKDQSPCSTPIATDDLQIDPWLHLFGGHQTMSSALPSLHHHYQFQHHHHPNHCDDYNNEASVFEPADTKKPTLATTDSALEPRCVEVQSVAPPSTTEDCDAVEPVPCLWLDCNEECRNQTGLVEHIEKYHIEMRKGQEFSCFWRDCPRLNKPFNARYKLLIHMRVHSGDKPNKCPVSGSEGGRDWVSDSERTERPTKSPVICTCYTFL